MRNGINRKLTLIDPFLVLQIMARKNRALTKQKCISENDKIMGTIKPPNTEFMLPWHLSPHFTWENHKDEWQGFWWQVSCQGGKNAAQFLFCFKSISISEKMKRIVTFMQYFLQFPEKAHAPSSNEWETQLIVMESKIFDILTPSI